MSGVTLQSTRFRNQPGPVIWLDVERRKADTEPALTSVHWTDGLTTYVHDPILRESAKARKLKFQHLSKREGAHRELTKAAKRDWRNLIEYNRQDVLGMIHLVEFVRCESAK
jgi:hypothetical protein